MAIVSVRPRESWLVMGFNVSHLTDTYTVQRASQEVQSALSRLPLRGAVAISFEGVENVTTQVAVLLKDARRLIDERFGRLVLCRVGDRMQELLRLTDMAHEFEVFKRLRDVLGESPRRQMALAGSSPRHSKASDLEWID
jgi:anti-anti-sigma regulatory factor